MSRGGLGFLWDRDPLGVRRCRAWGPRLGELRQGPGFPQVLVHLICSFSPTSVLITLSIYSPLAHTTTFCLCAWWGDPGSTVVSWTPGLAAGDTLFWADLSGKLPWEQLDSHLGDTPQHLPGSTAGLLQDLFSGPTHTRVLLAAPANLCRGRSTGGGGWAGAGVSVVVAGKESHFLCCLWTWRALLKYATFWKLVLDNIFISWADL